MTRAALPQPIQLRSGSVSQHPPEPFPALAAFQEAMAGIEEQVYALVEAHIREAVRYAWRARALGPVDLPPKKEQPQAGEPGAAMPAAGDHGSDHIMEQYYAITPHSRRPDHTRRRSDTRRS